jgi:hypothetical protein
MISRIAKLPRLPQYNHSAYWCANVYGRYPESVAIAFSDFEDKRSGETLGRLQK